MSASKMDENEKLKQCRGIEIHMETTCFLCVCVFSPWFFLRPHLSSVITPTLHFEDGRSEEERAQRAGVPWSFMAFERGEKTGP